MEAEKPSYAICDLHKGSVLLFCFQCKVIVCNECLEDHNKNGHKTQTLSNIAFEYQNCISKYKEEVSVSVIKKLTFLRNYKEEIIANIKVATVNLKKRINLLLEQLHSHLQQQEKSIEDKLNTILENLEQQSLCSEFDSDLRIVENITSQANQIEIINITTKTLDDKHKYKQSVIQHLEQDIHILKTNADKLINDCKDKEQLLKFNNQYLFNILSKIQLDQIKIIQEYELTMQEIVEEVKAKKEESIRFREEVELLIKEKYRLKEKIEALNKENKELREKVMALNEFMVGLGNNVERLNEEIKRLQTEINSYESIKKEKEELYIRVSEKFNHKILDESTKIAELGDLPFKEIDELSNSSILYVFDIKFHTLMLYNFSAKNYVSIPTKDYGICSNCGSVQVYDDLYIAGGFDIASLRFSRCTVKISLIGLEKVIKEQKKDMLLGKSQHKLITIDRKTLYSIGGKSRNVDYVSECERYNIEENKWDLAPNLNEAKINVAAIPFNNHLIYVFGGNKGKVTNTTELLDTRNLSCGWKILKLNGQTNGIAKEEAGCFQISIDQILIFGGVEEKTGSTDEVYIVNVSTCQIMKSKSRLCKKEWFAMRTPIRTIEGLIFIPGNFNLDFHIYDKKSMGWSIIEENAWMNSSQS